MLKIVIISFIIAVLVFTIAACKAAGKKDRWLEKWIEQRKKEATVNSKWCDDDCYRCEVNSWCKYNEAK